MAKHLLAMVAIVGLIGSVSLAAARTWTSGNGRFSIEAELLDFADGKAQLKKADGSVIGVSLASLSEKDQEYVKRRFPGAAQEEFRPGVEYRQWKSKNGKFSTLAEFQGYSDGKVQLRKPDGTEIEVDKNQLSPADQRWVADAARKLREEEAENKSAEKSTDKGEPEVNGQLGAQEIEMKLVRLDPLAKKSRGKATTPADYVFRLTSPQTFFVQLGKNNSANDAAFRKRIVKEPKYDAPVPFRGAARLGSEQYCFALDAAGSKATGYNRLYFDSNADGDLTNDKPIAALAVDGAGSGMVQSQFPRVDVAVELDGKKLDYAFFMNATCRSAANDSYAVVSLYSAAVREGFLAQGVKRTKLLLVDHNSNGRFDDAISLNARGSLAEGDLLLINPNPRNNLSGDAAMGRDRNFVGKVVCLGKNFCRMEVSPAGDNVKLTPTELVLGNVTNSSVSYRVVLFSNDYGAIMIGGQKDQKIPLPVGDWKVVQYTIENGAGTSAAATFGGQGTPVAVGKTKPAVLPFGAPFHAAVAANRLGSNRVALSLSIVGAAGEQCTSFYVNGKRPPRPQFVIKDKNGKIVQQGAFEYG